MDLKEFTAIFTPEHCINGDIATTPTEFCSLAGNDDAPLGVVMEPIGFVRLQYFVINN